MTLDYSGNSKYTIGHSDKLGVSYVEGFDLISEGRTTSTQGVCPNVSCIPSLQFPEDGEEVFSMEDLEAQLGDEGEGEEEEGEDAEEEAAGKDEL